MPLVSRSLIDPVTTDLNGTVINCTDVLTMETASVTIYVISIQGTLVMIPVLVNFSSNLSGMLEVAMVLSSPELPVL